MKYFLGFAEHQNNCTFAPGYILTLQRNSVNLVLSQQTETNAKNLASAGRVNKNDICWYVPHCFPSITNQKLLLGLIVSKTLTEFSFIKKSSYMKDVTTENN